MSDMTQADRDRWAKRNWWWKTLRTLHQQWVDDTSDWCHFDGWVADTHGITVLRDGQGNILGEYTISDEQKHLVFLLKFI